MPSVYLSNSQARRDLPTPACPLTVTSRAVPRSAVSCSIAFTSASSVSCPTNPASSPSTRAAPLTPATTRVACQSRSGSAFPLTVNSPASAYAIDACVAPRVTSSTSTVPGSAADWTRDAVFTRSPTTRPSSGFTIDAACPVTTPARAARPGTPSRSPSPGIAATTSSAARTARSASSSRATGEPPDGHHGVTDELLDAPAVPRDDQPGGLEVLRQEGPDVLRVPRLRKRRVADEVDEEDGHLPQLRGSGDSRRIGAWLGHRARLAAGASGPALPAELLPADIRGAARGARLDRHQTGAALPAELAAGLVGGTA